MTDLVLLLYLLLISLALGNKLLGLVKPRAGSFLEQSVFSLGLGLGAVAYSVYLLGLIGFLYRTVLWIYVVALTLVLLPEVINILRVFYQKAKAWLNSFQWRKYDLISYVAAIFLALHALLNLVGALAPETVFDAIWYHLALPKSYLANHWVFFVPQISYAAFPRTMEMLFTLGMGLHRDILAKLLHYSFGLLTSAAVFACFRRYFSPRFPLVAAAIFYIMQPVNMLSATAYIDLGLTYFEFLAAYALVNWWQSKERSWLAVTGVFAGLALGIKHQAILLVLTIAALLLFHYIFEERQGRRLVANLIRFGVPALVIAAPWYLDSYLKTGNPFYPLFNTLFGTGESYEQAMFASTGKASWYAGHSLIEYLTLPWKLTTGSYEGWLSPLYLLFLPAIFLVSKKPRVWRPALAFVWLFYSAYFGIVPFYTVRYFLPAAPILSLIVGFVLLKLWKRERFWRAVIVGVIFLTFSLNLGQLLFKTLPSATTAFGLKDRETYLTEMLVWYDVNRFVKRELPGGNKILVSGAPLFYYFDFPYEYGSGPQANSFSELARKLKRSGFTHTLLLVGAMDSESGRNFRLIYSRDLPPAPRSNAARGAKLYEIVD
jgi:hypothetical protein